MKLLLSSCSQIETIIGDIYRCFAEKVECADDLKNIWTKLAEDEDRHAQEIEFFSRLNFDEKSANEKLPKARADRYLSGVKSILEGIKITDIKENEALRISQKLESDLLEVHVTLSVDVLDKKTAEMFSCIVQNEKEHLAEFNRYLELKNSSH